MIISKYSCLIIVLQAVVVQVSISFLTSCGYFNIDNPLNSDSTDPTDSAITWQKWMGGSNEDTGSYVQQTVEQGFIIVGTTRSFGAGWEDVWLVKTDASGNEQWSKTFGGSSEDHGSFVQQITDRDYVITGSTRSFGAGGSDVYLIRTDSLGNERWSKTFGGSSEDQGRCVKRKYIGHVEEYVIVGFTASFGAGSQDVYLIKTDSSGNEQWSKTFGGSWNDEGFYVQQTSGEGLIIVGYTTSFGAGAHDAYLIKTDSSGNEQWSKTFGGEEMDYGYCVKQTKEGGYILVGETHSFGAGDFDAWLIKTDASGNEQWSKTFGGGAWDRADAVQQTFDGGYVIAGMTRSFGELDDAWLIKTDSSGNEQWSKTFGGSLHDRALCVQQIGDDGDYIMTGYTESFGAGDFDVYLIYYKP